MSSSQSGFQDSNDIEWSQLKTDSLLHSGIQATNLQELGKHDEMQSLLKESEQLQKEIGGLFNKFTDINKVIRADIDEFCQICDTSMANISASIDDQLIQ